MILFSHAKTPLTFLATFLEHIKIETSTGQPSQATPSKKGKERQKSVVEEKTIELSLSQRREALLESF